MCIEWRVRLVTTFAFPIMFCLQPFSMKNSASMPLKWCNSNKNIEVLCVLCRSTVCKTIHACFKSVHTLQSMFCPDLRADLGRSEGSQRSGLLWCFVGFWEFLLAVCRCVGACGLDVCMLTCVSCVRAGPGVSPSPDPSISPYSAAFFICF